MSQLTAKVFIMEKSRKKWGLTCLAIVLIVLVLIGTAVAVIDPYFHYHDKLDGLSYPINNERYQNNGMARHFTYDAILVGSSTASNYKSSDVDRCFGTNSAKLTYLGGTAKELHDTVETAESSGNDLKLVIWSMDHMRMLDAADTMRYDADSYPTYLYDDNPFNDVNYLFSMSSLEATYDVLRRTRAGFPTTSFDDYSDWSGNSGFGKDIIDGTYVDVRAKKQDVKAFTAEDEATVRDNLQKNFQSVIEAAPDTEFYFVIPVTSIYYWDDVMLQGNSERLFAAEQLFIDTLLSYDNVHVFSFLQDTDMAQDLDLFKDVTHFVPEYNSYMIEQMAQGNYEVTRENKAHYYEFIQDFYGNYDYEALFQ